MPYILENKLAARAYVTKRRAKTRCAKCGRKPIEWHNEAHERWGLRRVCNLAQRGYPIKVIAAEIAHCEPLCRSCHMNEDGRVANLLKGRDLMIARKAAITHCPQGHPYSGTNLYIGPGRTGYPPARQCRICRRQRVNEYDAKRRGNRDAIRQGERQKAEREEG